MKNDRLNCARKRLKAGDYLIKQIVFSPQIERKVDTKALENVMSEYTCDLCGCTNCGESILLYTCKRCGAYLCRCHTLMEKHNCIPIRRSWTEYTKWHSIMV